MTHWKQVQPKITDALTSNKMEETNIIQTLQLWNNVGTKIGNFLYYYNSDT